MKTPGFAIRFSKTPSELRYGAPLTGQHTDEVLTGAGFSPDEIEALIAAGAIGRGEA